MTGEWNWSLLDWAKIAAVATLVTASTDRAFGIAYWSSDFAIIENAPSNEPADLVHPNRDVTARVNISSGTVIAPNWILSAAHVLGSHINNPGVEFRVGSNVYMAKLDGTGQPMIFLHPQYSGSTFDVALVRIVTETGADPDLQSWMPIATDVPQVTPVTIGGYGRRNEIDQETLEVSEDLLPSGQFRWGRNLATVNITSISAQMDNPQNPPDNPKYVKYEGNLRPGDSGSGWFVRDGWEWRLAGISCCGSGPLDTDTATYLSHSAVFDWIQNTMGAEYPGSPSPQPKPVGTTAWTGPSGGNWNTPANWSNGVPKFDANQADIVNFDSSNVPQISGSAVALDVFVGKLATQQSLGVSSNGELTVNSLFLGAESWEEGYVSLNGGQIRAETEYVGFRGTGTFVQIGGANHAAVIYVGTHSGLGPHAGTYTLVGSNAAGNPAVVEAQQMTIGRDPGSIGSFSINATGQFVHSAVDVVTMVVGHSGQGTIQQVAGAVTNTFVVVGQNAGSAGTYTLGSNGTHNTWILTLGEQTNSTGVYNLSGNGSLTSSVLRIGDQGNGTFMQTGGTHTAGSIHIAPMSRYELRSGTIQNLGSVDNQGIFVFAGGTIGGTNLKRVTMSGTLDFESSGSALNVALGGFADLGDATVLNSTSASINMSAEGLLVVSPATHALISSSNLTVNTVNQPYHVHGQTLTINQHSVKLRTEAMIRDFVEVLHTSPTHGELIGISPVHLQKGIKVSSGGVVDLGSGVLTVPTGGEGGGPSSEINATINAFGAGRIDIEANGVLNAEGTFLMHQGISNRGRFNVGIGATGGRVVSIEPPPMVGGGAHFFNLDEGVIELRLDANGADKIVAEQFWLLGGTLNLDVDPALLPSLSFGDKFTILETHSGAAASVLGDFDRVTLSSITLNDLHAQGMALAVDYLDDTFLPSGLRSSKGVVVEVALRADFDFDGCVCNGDETIFLNNWQSQNATWAEGDATGDGIVNNADLTIFLNSWGDTVGGGSLAAAVPEPATMSLVGVALVGLVGLARRRV